MKVFLFLLFTFFLDITFNLYININLLYPMFTPRLAADPREVLAAEQFVEHGGLADVGPAHKGELGQAFRIIPRPVCGFFKRYVVQVHIRLPCVGFGTCGPRP